MADRPLLETPLRDWTYEALDQFLDAHIREDERIEYKEKFSDATFADTLVSMANGDGGFILVGVSDQQSLPVDWPLLDPGKNHALTAYNKAGSETSPPVRIDARPFSKPGGDGREVLVVRVEPGDNPPYFAKNRGVKVRVGESDVLADPRMLEYLFARRDQFSKNRAALREQLLARWGLGQDQARFGFRLLIAPAVGSATFALNDHSTQMIRAALQQSTLRVATSEHRNADGYHFGGPERRFSVLRSGQLRCEYLGDAPEATSMSDSHGGFRFPEQWPPIDFSPLLIVTYSTLRLAEQLFPPLTGYEGRFYVGAAASNLYDRWIEWHSPFGNPDRYATPEHTDQHAWDHDSAEFSLGDDPLDPTVQVIASLAWHQGYDNRETYIANWGSTLRRQRTDT